TPSPHFYTLSLHDALPILTTTPLDSWRAIVPTLRPIIAELVRSCALMHKSAEDARKDAQLWASRSEGDDDIDTFDEDLERASKRSEEHTSELQSLRHLVCR